MTGRRPTSARCVLHIYFVDLISFTVIRWEQFYADSHYSRGNIARFYSQILILLHTCCVFLGLMHTGLDICWWSFGNPKEKKSYSQTFWWAVTMTWVKSLHQKACVIALVTSRWLQLHIFCLKHANLSANNNYVLSELQWNLKAVFQKKRRRKRRKFSFEVKIVPYFCYQHIWKSRLLLLRQTFHLSGLLWTHISSTTWQVVYECLQTSWPLTCKLLVTAETWNNEKH